MLSSTVFSAQSAEQNNSGAPAWRWLAGLAYFLLVTATALIAANAGSQAAAEAGRCLLAERNGVWGILLTAALGGVPFVALIPRVRALLSVSSRWTAAASAVLVFFGHLALLLTFGFLLVNMEDTLAANLAHLAITPLSFAPTGVVASAALLTARTFGGKRVRFALLVACPLVWTALAAIAWTAAVARC